MRPERATAGTAIRSRSTTAGREGGDRAARAGALRRAARALAGHLAFASCAPATCSARRRRVAAKGGDGARRRWLFSGDVGRYDAPILHDPEPPAEAPDALLLESTYGDRRHEPTDPEEELAAAIGARPSRAAASVVIPAFALGRTQDLLYHLSRLADARPRRSRRGLRRQPDGASTPPRSTARRRRSTTRSCAAWSPPAATRSPPTASTRCRTVEESKALNERKEPAVIVAASGMATGGRVVHHLARRLPDPRNAVRLRRLPGRGHARPRAARRRGDDLDPRPPRRGAGRDRQAFTGSPRTPTRDELVRWCRALPAAPPPRLPQPRRRRGAQGARRDAGRARAGRAPSCRSRARSRPGESAPRGRAAPRVPRPRPAASARRDGLDRRRSSALAFTTLLSIVPLLAVVSIFVAEHCRADDGRIARLLAQLLPYREEAIVTALESFVAAGRVALEPRRSSASCSPRSPPSSRCRTRCSPIFGGSSAAGALAAPGLTLSLLVFWGPVLIGSAYGGLIYARHHEPGLRTGARRVVPVARAADRRHLRSV